MGSSTYLSNTNTFRQNVTYSDLGDKTLGGVLGSDDFNSGVLDPNRWTQYKSVAGSNATIGVVNSLLRFTLGTNGANYSYLDWIQARGMRGQSVELDIVTHMVGTSVEAYFLIQNSTGGYCFIYEENNNLLCRIYNNNGSQTIGQYYVQGIANAQTKWRIRHANTGGNGTLYLETYTGGAWVTRQTTAAMDWTPSNITVSIRAGRYASGSNADLWEVDNFIITGEVNPPPLVTIPQKSFLKDAGGNAYNAGLVSKRYIQNIQFDQSVRMIVGGAAGVRRFGWTTGSTFDYGVSGRFEMHITETGVLQIIEDGVVVNSNVRSVATDNELRIQIINDNGFKVRYHWRARTDTEEQVVFTSAKTDAHIRASFPVYGKALIFTQGSSILSFSMEENGAGVNLLTINDTPEGTLLPAKPENNIFVARNPGQLYELQEVVALEIPTEIQYKGANLNAPDATLLFFHTPGAILDEIEIRADGSNALGDAVFNLYHEGTPLFTPETRPVILGGETTAIKQGLNIPTAYGDKIVLALEEITGGAVVSPVTLLAKFKYGA